jgi:hypothetical protein
MSLGRDYVEIVLRLGRLAEGWVDNYTGPAQLIVAVAPSERDSVGYMLGAPVRHGRGMADHRQ